MKTVIKLTVIKQVRWSLQWRNKFLGECGERNSSICSAVRKGFPGKLGFELAMKNDNFPDFQPGGRQAHWKDEPV